MRLSTFITSFVLTSIFLVSSVYAHECLVEMPAPIPDPIFEPVIDSTGKCSTGSTSLVDARNQFVVDCAGFSRVDCDPSGGFWYCGSYKDPRSIIEVSDWLSIPNDPVIDEPELPDYSNTGSLLTSNRITQCESNGNPIRYSITGAVPNDGKDDHVAIQNVINDAHAKAISISGNCSVEAYLSAGLYNTSKTILVPDRVIFSGVHLRDTKIHYKGNLHGIQLRNSNSSTDPVRYVGVRDLYVTMNDGRGDDPNLGGHCVSSIRGVTDTEFKNLVLDGCDFYGIGMQQSNANSNEAPYERVTVKNVRISSVGSDGIDMKSTNIQNNDVEFHDICMTNIANTDDGAWSSALDLAGNDISVDGFSFISSSQVVNGSATNGIAINGGGRRVTNSYINDVYIKRAAQALISDPDNSSRNIEIGNVRIVDSWSGVNMSGYDHFSTGDICVTNAKSDAKAFSVNGNDIQLSSCPTTDFFAVGNAVCGY